MAIYKPTNCSPYLATLDLVSVTQADAEPHYFMCKVDTSNVKVTAYSIVVYNEENTQVFPVDVSGDPITTPRYTYVSDLSALKISDSNYLVNKNLNTGLNGSYLKIPFIVKSDYVDDSRIDATTVPLNLIYIEGESTPKNYCVGAVNGNNITYTSSANLDIENGYSYKWIITLYQGVEKVGAGVISDDLLTPNEFYPDSYYDYDMVLTSGQILGTNNERIQSVPSENIFVDYYIQPVIAKIGEGTSAEKATFDAQTGRWEISSGQNLTYELTSDNRVRIKNYDNSYGHVYPQTGNSGFSQQLFLESNENRPNGFVIYKNTNDPSVMSDSRKVLAVPNMTLPWEWEDMADDSQSYALQTYYISGTLNENANTKLNPFFLRRKFADGRDYRYEVSGTSSTRTAIPFPNLNFQSYGAAAVAGTDDYGFSNVSLSEGDIIVFNYQFDFPLEVSDDDNVVSNDYWYNPSPGGTLRSPNSKNGVYVLDDVNETEVTLYTAASGGYQATFTKRVLQWRRTSTTNTWGGLVNSVFFVESNDNSFSRFARQNIQAVAQDDSGAPEDPDVFIGTINQTPIQFDVEQPVEIFSYQDAQQNENLVAPIFYNQKKTASNVGRLYVRPMVGLSDGMWLQLIDNGMDSFHLITQNTNTKFWFVEYENLYQGRDNNNEVETEQEISIGTRYQIRSFFKAGDETPFDFADSPTVALKFRSSPDSPQDFGIIGSGDKYKMADGSDSEDVIPDSEVNKIGVLSRILYCYADYQQAQHISWKSFKWELYDDRDILVNETDTIYDGNIETTFYGLAYRESYRIVLTIETQNDLVIVVEEQLHTIFGQIEENKFPFEVALLCDLAAVQLDFALTGYVLPNQPVILAGEERTRFDMKTDSSTTIPNTSPPICGVTYGEGTLGTGMTITASSSLPETGVYYDTLINTWDSSEATRSPMVTDGDTITIKSQHTLFGNAFEGEILRADFHSENAIPNTNPPEYDEIASLSVWVPKRYQSDWNYFKYKLSFPEESKVPEQSGTVQLHNTPIEGEPNAWAKSSDAVLITNNTQNQSIYDSYFANGKNGEIVSLDDEVHPWIWGESEYSKQKIFLDAYLNVFSAIQTVLYNASENPSPVGVTVIHPLKPLNATAEEVTNFSVVASIGASREDFNVWDGTSAGTIQPFYVKEFSTEPVIWHDTVMQGANVIVNTYNGSGELTGYTRDIVNGNKIDYIHTTIDTTEPWIWNDSDDNGPLYWNDGSFEVSEGEESFIFVGQTPQPERNVAAARGLDGVQLTFDIHLNDLESYDDDDDFTNPSVSCVAYYERQGGQDEG